MKSKIFTIYCRSQTNPFGYMFSIPDKYPSVLHLCNGFVDGKCKLKLWSDSRRDLAAQKCYSSYLNKQGYIEIYYR